MPIECSPADIARFMKHVDKLPCGCWFWTGATSKGRGKSPYGTFWVNKKVGRVRAHRFACEVIGGKGELPKGHDRDHTCCFSLCVNPNCIEYVTKLENQTRKRDRKLSGERDGSRILA